MTNLLFTTYSSALTGTVGFGTNINLDCTNGYVTAVKHNFANGVQITTGTGTPEAAVTAPVGSAFLRSDGSTNTTLYVKQTGAGNTGWVGMGSGGTALTISTQAGTTYTLAVGDNGSLIRFTSATAVTVTIPSTLSVGFSCACAQYGAGQITFAAGVGSTVNSYLAQMRTAGQYGEVSVVCVAAATYLLAGSLTA